MQLNICKRVQRVVSNKPDSTFSNPPPTHKIKLTIIIYTQSTWYRPTKALWLLLQSLWTHIIPAYLFQCTCYSGVRKPSQLSLRVMYDWGAMHLLPTVAGWCLSDDDWIGHWYFFFLFSFIASCIWITGGPLLWTTSAQLIQCKKVELMPVLVSHLNSCLFGVSTLLQATEREKWTPTRARKLLSCM